MSEISCTCRDWTKQANYPFFPIWYNAKTDEYVIVFGQIAANSIVVYFCPSCGRRIHKPRLRKFFTMPSDEELAEARTILENITDVDTMRSMLGEPDEVFEWYKDDSGESLRDPDGPSFKWQYTYSSRWKTLRVVIQECENEQLRFYFYGQPKDSSTLESIGSLLNRHRSSK